MLLGLDGRQQKNQIKEQRTNIDQYELFNAFLFSWG